MIGQRSNRHCYLALMIALVFELRWLTIRPFESLMLIKLRESDLVTISIVMSMLSRYLTYIRSVDVSGIPRIPSRIIMRSKMGSQQLRSPCFDISCSRQNDDTLAQPTQLLFLCPPDRKLAFGAVSSDIRRLHWFPPW